MNTRELIAYNRRTQCQKEINAKFRVARASDVPIYLTLNEVIKHVWGKKCTCRAGGTYSIPFVSQQLKLLGFQNRNKKISGKIIGKDLIGNTYSMPDGRDKIIKVWIVVPV